jgi:hypothetical protein
MRLEFLLQFIVPLTFLAIWALTSLLNRDAQPLPQRPGTARGPVPGSPRAGAAGGFSSAARGDMAGQGRVVTPTRPASSGPERTTTARWSTATTQQGRPSAFTTRPGTTSDEGIVILESETRPSQSSSSFSPSSSVSNARVTRGSGAASRRAAPRGRNASPSSLKPIEQERPRALTGLVAQSLAQKKNRPLDIVPLSTPITPISSPLMQVSQSSTPEAARSTAVKTQPTLTSDALRTMLASPTKLREVALLGELLQPPVALRAHRRPH